jgi:chemotaxis protein methyltransferase CheR
VSITLTKANFEKLGNYVYRKSGISLSFDKHFDKLQKVLIQRGKELSVKTFRQYFTIIRFEDKDGEEFQNLINSLTVNETYFFRENYQFEALISNIIPEINNRKPKGSSIRILSAPCSTGEEAYSIALHLLEDDTIINERDIEIVGIDIDSKVIEKANEGLYSERSVHALSPKVKECYFDKIGREYQIDEDLTEAIEFKVANVFSKEEMRKLGKFDVIFSRNMLIYFDDASRKEVAMTFYDMLNPYGYILLGHAEFMNKIVSVFHPKKFEQALVYQK